MKKKLNQGNQIHNFISTVNQGNQIHNFISSFGSRTVINYGSID